MYRFALPRVNGDPDVAKEIVQATLVKGLRNLRGYRFEALLFTWLCQIRGRLIVDYVRVNKRFREAIVLIDDCPELRVALGEAEGIAVSDPQHAYSNAERLHLIRSIPDHLRTRYGDVLEWKYIDGYSVEEMGQLLGIGHVAAQSVLARARAAFRRSIGTVFGASADDLLAGMQ